MRSAKYSTRMQSGTRPRIWCKSLDLAGLMFRKMPTNGVIVRQLDFTPMDAFMNHVLEAFRVDAQLATRLFPASSRVILSFCDRVANDVVSLRRRPRTLLITADRGVHPPIPLSSTSRFPRPLPPGLRGDLCSGVEACGHGHRSYWYRANGHSPYEGRGCDVCSRVKASARS